MSHCTIVRSRIDAHSTGATSTSGERVITIPPLWIPMCRGKPSMRRQIFISSAPSSPPTGPRKCASGSGPKSLALKPYSARAFRRRLESPACARGRALRRGCRRRASSMMFEPASRSRRFAIECGSAPLFGVRRAERAGERLARVVLAHDLIDLAEREPERFADVADRRARAVGDHLGRHRRVLAPVALVHVLDHLLAVLVREVDVDVGDLAALFAQEPLEQKPALDRVDRGDPERVADRRVRRRAAALREHAQALAAFAMSHTTRK